MTRTKLIEPRIIAKPWGRTILPQPFAQSQPEPIGEIAFDPPTDVSEILVKFLFTSEALSVQVHPGTHTTPARTMPVQGKEECWYVIDAEPGAHILLGLNEPVDEPTLRQAALDGTIELLLHSYSVNVGDFIHIPPGTIHAIGAGISIVEIQQNSDATYRLFDYGRPRELHLEAALRCADRAAVEPAKLIRHTPAAPCTLLSGTAFQVDLYNGPAAPDIVQRYRHAPLILIPLSGSCNVDGTCLEPGSCGIVTHIADIRFEAGSQGLLAQPRTTQPRSAPEIEATCT